MRVVQSSSRIEVMVRYAPNWDDAAQFFTRSKNLELGHFPQ